MISFLTAVNRKQLSNGSDIVANSISVQYYNILASYRMGVANYDRDGERKREREREREKGIFYIQIIILLAKFGRNLLSFSTQLSPVI